MRLLPGVVRCPRGGATETRGRRSGARGRGEDLGRGPEPGAVRRRRRVSASCRLPPPGPIFFKQEAQEASSGRWRVLSRRGHRVGIGHGGRPVARQDRRGGRRAAGCPEGPGRVYGKRLRKTDRVLKQHWLLMPCKSWRRGDAFPLDEALTAEEKPCVQAYDRRDRPLLGCKKLGCNDAYRFIAGWGRFLTQNGLDVASDARAEDRPVAGHGGAVGVPVAGAGGGRHRPAGRA